MAAFLGSSFVQLVAAVPDLFTSRNRTHGCLHVSVLEAATGSLLVFECFRFRFVFSPDGLISTVFIDMLLDCWAATYGKRAIRLSHFLIARA